MSGTARRARPRWTLRRRLVAVVVALVATVAAVMGLASTLALRSSLLRQIDDRLDSASTRAAAAPGRLDRAQELGLAPGVKATALIKASHIILGAKP